MFQVLSVVTGGPVVVWSQVSACLPGRNSKSCRKRWIHSLDPTLRKGRWTEGEDALLITAVEMHSNHWFQVAKMLPGRTDDQCAKRWRENLDPSISRKPWTEGDDELLMGIYEQIGKRWKDIASRFEGRPPVHCRNRVQSLVRARRRSAAATRKTTRAKMRGKELATNRKAIDVEPIQVPSDFAGGVCVMISPPCLAFD
ncbi:hypothetical protein BDM02DRAFT_3098250 [Thelephora ganbajun]|uniref:Uncharacterized protein n=1 Tax=Thelephora ganbajun TaxID=370292 RepID=A0ACB6ZCT0_THEGA|nr:hypothetical protein BDM02DRAFT_3098250 [Thelephora ganbajun]